MPLEPPLKTGKERREDAADAAWRRVREESDVGTLGGEKNAHLPTCAHNDHGCDYVQLPASVFAEIDERCLRRREAKELARRGFIQRARTGNTEGGREDEQSVERWIFARRGVATS